MILPQDREDPEGQQNEIRYVIVKSRSENPLPDPILYLSGGPGSSAIHPDAFPELVDRFDGLRQERDLILFDQRGVGYSTPPFDCSKNPTPPEGEKVAEFDARYERETGIKVGDIPEEYQFEYTCVSDLWNKGIELAQYNSVVNAQDTVNLMNALSEMYGYPSFNLYGISYGTRLALTVLRDFPGAEHIRTTVLDSVFALEKGEYSAQYYIERNALFESVFQLCAEDTECSQAYPNLRERFGTLVEKLNTEPLQLSDETTLTGDDLHQSMFPAGPDWPQRILYFPKMIAELESGTTETFMGLRSGSLLPESSPLVKDEVYNLMGEIENCTKITDPDQRQSYLRRMYNASREEVVPLFQEICTEEEMAPILSNLNNMETQDVNQFVVRLYDPRKLAGTPQLRKSMDCYEEVPFGEDPATAEQKMREAGLPEFLIQEGLSTIGDTPRCQYWPTGVAPEIENQPVKSIASVLILNGQFDSITYPWWAEETHGHLPKSSYAMIPGATHSIVGNNGACVDQITIQFLSDLTRSPDTDCLSALEIQFILP
jgi:pimeloyl-ACP methyl ester carboxylesterase